MTEDISRPDARRAAAAYLADYRRDRTVGVPLVDFADGDEHLSPGSTPYQTVDKVLLDYAGGPVAAEAEAAYVVAREEKEIPQLIVDEEREKRQLWLDQFREALVLNRRKRLTYGGRMRRWWDGLTLGTGRALANGQPSLHPHHWSQLGVRVERTIEYGESLTKPRLYFARVVEPRLLPLLDYREECIIKSQPWVPAMLPVGDAAAAKRHDDFISFTWDTLFGWVLRGLTTDYPYQVRCPPFTEFAAP